MESGKTDVFISYRRDGGSAEARLIRSALGERGLNTFLDVTSLTHGMFDESRKLASFSSSSHPTRWIGAWKNKTGFVGKSRMPSRLAA